MKEWEEYSQEIINNATDSFKKRLKRITNTKGGYIEHYRTFLSPLDFNF